MMRMTISKISEEAGVGVETVRFYERKGLVTQPPKPPTGGYRSYPETWVLSPSDKRTAIAPNGSPDGLPACSAGGKEYKDKNRKTRGGTSMSKRRKIQIFSAGCPPCEEAVSFMKPLISSSWEVRVVDMNDPKVFQRAKRRGIASVASVGIDDRPEDDCRCKCRCCG